LAVAGEVAPGRRGRILEVGHEHLGPGVQRIDDHLRIGRAGDLDAAVLQCGRDRRHRPVALADGAGVGTEIRQAALVEKRLTPAARGQPRLPARLDRPVQRYQQAQRTGRQQRGLAGQLGGQGDARGRARRGVCGNGLGDGGHWKFLRVSGLQRAVATTYLTKQFLQYFL
jgi:hypothetical protein